MKVYGVRYQMYYEYTEVEDVLYKSREDARVRAAERVKEDAYNYHNCRRVSADEWDSDTVNISVVEFEVKD